MKRALGLLVLAGVGIAQTYEAAGPDDSLTYTKALSAKREAAAVRTSDVIFPHMATGGGWETILVLVNMSSRTVSFRQGFFSGAGDLMNVTFRTFPQNELVTTSLARGTLPPGTSFNILLHDRGQPLQIGWSILDYDATLDRIGGFSIFRQIFPGGTTFEALVPLSSIDDFRFYMPFDNLEGFVTTMAILNPNTVPTDVRLTFRDTNGVVIANETIRLGPATQTAFVIPERFRATAGRVGVLYAEASTNLLSALGFRFSSRGAFATIPIMNWVGMFP